MKKQSGGNNRRSARKPKEKPLPTQVKQMGARIRHFRKKKGYKSYEDFAYTHDFHSSQYFGYEKGKNIEFVTLLRVLKALNVSLKDFFAEGFD